VQIVWRGLAPAETRTDAKCTTMPKCAYGISSLTTVTSLKTPIHKNKQHTAFVCFHKTSPACHGKRGFFVPLRAIISDKPPFMMNGTTAEHYRKIKEQKENKLCAQP